MNIYFFVGKGSIGKSTLIRNLTGVGNTDEGWKLFELGYTRPDRTCITLIRTSAMQETHEMHPPELIRFLRAKRKKGIEHVFIPLRKSESRGYPAAEAYILPIIAEFTVAHIFCLEPDTNFINLGIKNLCILVNDMPNNIRAERIRKIIGLR